MKDNTEVPFWLFVVAIVVVGMFSLVGGCNLHKTTGRFNSNELIKRGIIHYNAKTGRKEWTTKQKESSGMSEAKAQELD